MKRTASLFLALCVAPLVLLDAQQPPARDGAGARPAVGAAVIAGTVVTDEATPKPLRRVTVSLNAAGSTPSTGRATVTDDQGRFSFSKLPAGNYTPVRATKPGYVAAAYGQKRVNGQGVPIALAEGQRVSIVIKMTRGAVITGTVLDQSGRPSPGVSVQATQVRVVNGERQPVGSAGPGGSVSDDRGIYRIFGLPPGDFIVSALPRFSASGDVRPVTVGEVRWAQQQLQPAGAPLVTTGAAAPGQPASPPPAGQAVAYSPMYYPGTNDPAAAVPVTLAGGQELSGIDIRAGFVATAKIEGTVVDLDGQPAQNVQINLIPKGDASAALISPIFMFETVMGNRPQVTGGKFVVPAVRPGEYMLMARSTPRPGVSPPAANLWAMTDVTVSGVDQSGIALRLEPGMTLTGRVAFEGTTLQPPSDLTRVVLRMQPAPTTGTTVSVNLSSGQVAADGSFTFTGLTPGKYLLNGTAPAGTPVPGSSWALKSAKVGAVDAADTGFEVRPGQDVPGAVLTFTDKVGEVSGTLTDASGKPTSDFSVLLFSADRANWFQRSRRFRTPVRAGTDGAFKFTNLPAGDYYLAALTDFEQSDVANPAFLDQVAASSAIKITLGDGEKKVQDLKLAGG